MKIIPIKTGNIHCNKGFVITMGKDIGKWIDIPSIAWYIDTGEYKILVDTGMCDTEKANKYHYKDSKQGEDERIDLALKKIGVNVEDIDIVIYTHLHWDHCSNEHLFKNAKFYVQKKELEFAKNPIPPYYGSYESDKIGMIPPFSKTDFILIERDKEIVPGIEVFLTLGHSPGHQSVLVKTEKGNYVIAGDAVMCYENLEGDEEKGLEFTMIGRYFDIGDAWKSLGKVKEKADFILPGHEERVFEKQSYP